MKQDTAVAFRIQCLRICGEVAPEMYTSIPSHVASVNDVIRKNRLVRRWGFIKKIRIPRPALTQNAVNAEI